MRLALAILIGAVLGVIGARYLFVGSWLSLVPWSIAGLALGYRARPGGWVRAGGAYGFALLLAFMIAGYTGAAPLLTRLPFFAIIAVVGAIYGLVLAWAGSALRRIGHRG